MSKVNVSRLKTFTGHNDCVYTIEKTQYEQKFFSGAGDGMVACWDMEEEDGQLIAKLPNSIYALHYNADYNLLIVGHNYDGIHLLDWESKKEVSSLKMTDQAIFDINSYKGQLLVGDASGMVTVVDIKNLQVLHKIKAASKSARSIAISEKREEVAIGYSDNAIRIFSLEDYRLKEQLTGHQNSVFVVKYSPDGQLLLSAGRDAHLKVWDATAGYIEIQDIVAHMYAINNLDFSPDGKHFVTCSMDKSIKVWDAQAFKLLKVIDKARHAGHGTSVNKVLWSSYNDFLISASDDRAISVWDLQFNT